MNRFWLPLGRFVALAFCVFVAVLAFTVYKNLPANKEPLVTAVPAALRVKVVLAAHDLQFGAKLSERDVRVVSIPASVAPPVFFQSASGLIGRVVIVPIQKGEFVLPSKLATNNAGSGLPALSIPIASKSASSDRPHQ